LQLYPIVAADALLEIFMAVISAVLLLNEHLLQMDNRCPEILLPLGILLSFSEVPGCALLNGS
jgi:hypothetical protein